MKLYKVEDNLTSRKIGEFDLDLRHLLQQESYSCKEAFF